MNQNLARAIGPAIGAAGGDQFRYGLLGQRGLVRRGARGAHDLALDPPRRCAAARARWRGDPGRRPVHRLQPRAAGDLGRAGLFIVFASAIWALLPLIAQSTL
ncbi:hypothetical protein, partial [Trebonia sp.]|uniref:hypothetical protein n=1 Tax=Trebonia sp. TaxID=2767075 RepID=UPI003C717BC6